MAEKTKIKIDSKKVLEKLIAENPKNIKEKNKKVISKDLSKETESKDDKNSKKLENVIINDADSGIDLKNLGLVQTDQVGMKPAFAENLEKSVFGVSINKKDGKSQEQLYSDAVNRYDQHEEIKEETKKSAVRNVPFEIPRENLHLTERTNILSTTTPLKTMGMIRNPELERTTNPGYEPYKTTRTDATPKKPWETHEGRIKKYS